MRAQIILKIVEEIYRNFLRGLICAAVENSPTEWDNRVVDLLDVLLNFKRDQGIPPG